MASQLPNFQTQLDWAVFGTPNGAIYNGVWTTNNILPSGVDVSVSAQGVSGSAEGLRLAYNMGSVFMGGDWVPASLPANQPYSFGGHFDAPPDAQPTSAVAPGSPGDHLLGLALDGTPLGGSPHDLVVDFSSGVTNVGFRVSSVYDANFTVRVQVFTGLDGTGTMLSDSSFSYTGSGGQCAGLFVSGTRPTPVPCNDAPFIAALGYNKQAQSVLISTTDARGFYVGDLFVSDAPEPASVILSGFGILAIVARRRGWLRRA
jgi:hypothetical protein